MIRGIALFVNVQGELCTHTVDSFVRRLPRTAGSQYQFVKPVQYLFLHNASAHSQSILFFKSSLLYQQTNINARLSLRVQSITKYSETTELKAYCLVNKAFFFIRSSRFFQCRELDQNKQLDLQAYINSQHPATKRQLCLVLPLSGSGIEADTVEFP